MKKLMKPLALLMLVSFGLKIQAQTNNFKRVQDAQEITWYGIDYSKNKLVGLPADFKNLTAITQNYYGGINNLFLSEPQKYDIGGATGKKINFKIETALTNGTKVDTSTLVTVERQQLSAADVQEAIKQFKSDVSCVGMTMVMENFDKPMKMVRLHLVFFDPSTSEILFTKRYETPVSGGFGFRNYYASGIYQTIKKIGLEFPTWGQPTKK
jgi:hypothetical protein